MSDAIDDIDKSRRGRPRTDATPVMVRLHPADLAALDAWIEQRASLKATPLTRPEAIRRILRTALDQSDS